MKPWFSIVNFASARIFAFYATDGAGKRSFSAGSDSTECWQHMLDRYLGDSVKR